MDLAALEQRISRIESLEAIKQLKARYCEVCDDDHNPDEIVTLFTAMAFGKAMVLALRKVTSRSASCFSAFNQQ